jgi:hypothetical protein
VRSVPMGAAVAAAAASGPDVTRPFFPGLAARGRLRAVSKPTILDRGDAIRRRQLSRFMSALLMVDDHCT